MRVKKHNSSKLILINVRKYKINWDKAPSKEQKILQDFLYPIWKNYIVLAEMRVPGTLWRFDIVNCSKKIIIEYSPISHHFNYNPWFHKNRMGYLKSIQSDIAKYKWATEENDFKLIEIIKDDLSILSTNFFIKKFNIDVI